MTTRRIAILFASLLFASNASETLAITFLPLDVPGSIETLVEDVDGTNIVGYYEDSLGQGHGFVFDGSTYTTLDHPLGANGTYATGISGGLIVGG